MYSGVGGLVVKSCSTLATAWTVACRAPLSMGFPGKNTGVGCHFLLQGIFLTQRWNPGLLHYRQSPYQLSYKGSQSHIHCVTNYPDGSAGKESACNAGDRGDVGLIIGLGRCPGEGHGMATHCSILVSRIPWTEGPGGLQSDMAEHYYHHYLYHYYLASSSVTQNF